jgi:hypothetical protein
MAPGMTMALRMCMSMTTNMGTTMRTGTGIDLPGFFE